MARPGVHLMLYLSFIIGYECATPEGCGKPKPNTDTHRLKAFLLCNYDRSVRPVIRTENKTVVDMELWIEHVMVYEWLNTVNAQTLLALRWSDAFLSWDPADYGNISFIHLPAGTVWTPDFSVYNNKLRDMSLRVEGYPVLVESSGIVNSMVESIITSHCNTDIYHWPFDKQDCQILVGSRAYMGRHMDINIVMTKKMKLYNNPYWETSQIKAFKNVSVFTNNEYHIYVTYAFSITRHSSFLISLIVVPTIVFSVLILSSFWLSPLEYYRTVILIISMFGCISFLLYLGQKVTPNGTTGIFIAIFLRNSLIISSASLISLSFIKGILRGRYAPAWFWNLCATMKSSQYSNLMFLPEDSKTSADEQCLVNTMNAPKQEWIIAAAIVDRILFCIALINYIITLCLL